MMKITLCLFLNTLLSVGNAQTPCSAAVAEPLVFPTEAANNAAPGGGDNSGRDLTVEEAKYHLENQDMMLEYNNMQNEMTRSSAESLKLALPSTREETCFLLEDWLFCANEQTADFHDEGGAGNLGTGSYTFLDGQVTASSTEESTGAVSSSPTTGGAVTVEAVTVEATPTHTSGQLARSTAARDSGLSSSSTNISLGSNGNNSGASSLRLLDITATSLAVLVGSLYGWTLIFQ